MELSSRCRTRCTPRLALRCWLPARRRGISAAGGVRERGDLLLAKRRLESASWPFAARWVLRAAVGAPILYRGVPACAAWRQPWSTGSILGLRGLVALARKICRGWTALDQYSGTCVRVGAFHRRRGGPWSVHRRARDFRRTAARAWWKAGVDKRVCKAASALAA